VLRAQSVRNTITFHDYHLMVHRNYRRNRAYCRKTNSSSRNKNA